MITQPTAMRLFTTTEAAEYLRLKERKVYELVAEGAIPCTKVTGKWLFPQAELDQWLAPSLSRPKGMRAAEPVPIVGGSHDPLLEWALRESGSGLATLPEGSEAGSCGSSRAGSWPTAHASAWAGRRGRHQRRGVARGAARFPTRC